VAYFFSVFFGTFILEDVALISSLELIELRHLSFLAAFTACFLGICIGDLGLYFVGYFASRLGIEKKLGFFKKYHATLALMRKSQFLTYSIVISRAVPGTRLPTYLASGFLHYSFWKFLLLTALSVLVWVLMALLGGRSIQYIFMDHWILGMLSFILCLRIFKSLIPTLANPWSRKVFCHSWRKWTSFEFWPAWFFYIPIVPYYIYLSLRYRTLFAPFYASPLLANGGLIGESKWDFLQHLSFQDASTLKTLRIGPEIGITKLRENLGEENMIYPLIIKPDVGQRGFGVRILRNDFDLSEYLLLSPFDRILQKYSEYACEAGLFYVRRPWEKNGFIFSVTDKKFPFITGDGETRLGDLILRNKRARIIAATYFARLKERLDTIPTNGEVIFLSECGNHCQGAIFLNGKDLVTPALTWELDRIAKQIPQFYFGRFDIRYKNVESLKQGLNFEIVEVNGSGSEATHIWDAKTTLWEAYRTLFTQWRLLFSIGAYVKKNASEKANFTVFSFLKECVKVVFRKESLSVSS
jgi:membrane protein DedA with SNARE-associated domain